MRLIFGAGSFAITFAFRFWLAIGVIVSKSVRFAQAIFSHNEALFICCGRPSLRQADTPAVKQARPLLAPGQNKGADISDQR
jgi:heme A synthase